MVDRPENCASRAHFAMLISHIYYLDELAFTPAYFPRITVIRSANLDQVVAEYTRHRPPNLHLRGPDFRRRTFLCLEVLVWWPALSRRAPLHNPVHGCCYYLARYSSGLGFCFESASEKSCRKLLPIVRI
jgi:hypothetical protein